MKRTLCLIWLISTLVYSGQSNDVKRGKVYSSTQGYIHLSPFIGERILEDGSDIAIDMRPQGVEKYHDKTLSKGISMQTAINAHLQTNVASEIDVQRMELGAKESFVGVMNNHTGELIMLARSSKLDPITIRTKEIPILKDRFADFLFEPGSLLVPIWATILAEQKDAKECASQLKETGDEPKWESLLSAESMLRGLNAFGFGKVSGIDLPYDEAGNIPLERKLKSEESRLSLLQGNGLQVTFMQMLKAYSAFSAKGLLLTPHIASSIIENNVTKKLSFPTTRAFSKVISSRVKRGLVNKAKRRNDILMMDLIDVGGAYGTNNLSKEGNASGEAFSAYFGFADDILGNSFTIGVFLIYEKKIKSKDVPTPMPIFNLVIEELGKEKYLHLHVQHTLKGAMSPMPKGNIVEYFSEQIERVPECLENTKGGISLDCQYTTYRSPEDGAFVHAVLDGKVTFVGSHKKYGKVVIVRHDNKTDTVYANLDYITSGTKKGVPIKKGYRVGRVTETLRFQLIKDKKRVDPLEYLELL